MIATHTGPPDGEAAAKMQTTIFMALKPAGRQWLPRLVLAAILLGGAVRALAAGTWTALSHTAPESINTMLLLSDGTVVGAGGSDNTWFRLTPDSTGSYVNGTWTSLASMHYSRLYYSSDILTDGRLFVAGSEYFTGTNSAEVYDPLANTWTTTPPPPAGQTLFYDCASKILPNGNILISPVSPATSGGTVIYNFTNNAWIVGPRLFRGSYQDEASWVKLPDDSILTIDPFGVNSERYIPSLNQWVNDANVPVSLYDPYGSELGGAFLLPSGKVIFLGATGNTAIYTPSGTTNFGSWVAGPVFPSNTGTPDAPACMMVNGNILCAVSPTPVSTNHFPSPTTFYEYDPVANAFTAVNGPTGSTLSGPSYTKRMLALPSGDVLLSISGNQLYTYHPTTGAPLAAGKPAISNLTQNANSSYHITGTLFNGISEGAAYGDDAQMDSNYPIIRLTNSVSGAVYYSRSFNWSSTSVMTGSRLVSTEFTLPVGLPMADYQLMVVANGNSSEPIAFSTATSPPTIVIQPKSQTLTAGQSVMFTVGAAGTPLSYYWQRNGASIAGANSSSYTTNNLQLADSGAVFTCIASNVNGTTLTTNAILTVIPGSPPTIVTQPLSQTNIVTGTASFSLVATSTVPISYYWHRGGVLIGGATTASYTTNNVQLSDSGAVFSCITSNQFGTTLSSNAILTVIPGSPPTIVTQPLSQTNIVGGTASFSLVATSTVPISYYWRRGGVFISGATTSSYATNNLQLADSGAIFSCVTSNQFGATLSTNAFLTVVVPLANDSCSGAIAINGTNFTTAQSTTLASSIGDPAPSCVSSLGKGVWFSFTAPSSGTVVADTIGSDFDTGLGAYSGSCAALTQVACDDDSGGSLTSLITNAITGGVTYYYLVGGYGGTSGNLIFHFNFSSTGTPPAITVQPESLTVAVNGTANFSVTASGTPPLSYFWRRNGSPIAGASNSFYSTNNVQPADSGSLFSCLVSNSLGTLLSSNALLTVASTSTSNLVQNWDFETGDFTSWDSPSSFAGLAVVNIAPYPHSGTYGAQAGPVGSLSYLGQTLATTHGQSYIFGCWLHGDGNTPNEFMMSWDGRTVLDLVNYATADWTNINLIVYATNSTTAIQFGFQNDPSYFGMDDVTVIPLVAPTIQSVTRTNGNLRIAWSSIPGLVYRVQYKTNLVQANWINLGGGVTASGITTTVSDPIGPDPRRFYHVVLVP